tara:strand:- start:393 stop:587 length:195 start_codon:yes stop_codon:yes gene_type:complete
MKENITVLIVTLALIVLSIVGEVKCIVKAINCNWEPVGKAEIVYTGSAVIGLGAIIGYMDFEDK